jgi:hypothetical protein
VTPHPLSEIFSSKPFLSSLRILKQFLPEQMSPFLMHYNHQRGGDDIYRIRWFRSNGTSQMFSRFPLSRKPAREQKHGTVRPSFARQRTCLARRSRTTHVGFSLTSVSEHRRKRPFAIPAQNENQPSPSLEKCTQKPVLSSSPETVLVSNKSAFSLFALGFFD